MAATATAIRHEWLLRPEDVEYIADDAHRLGSGGFGSVYEGRWWQMREPVAVKLLRMNSDNHDAFIDEVRVWASIPPHPNIVPLFGVCLEGDTHFMVAPKMENGTILQYLAKQKSAGADLKELKLSLLYDVALGMSRLEILRIVHADLKPLNILVTSLGRGSVTDFGLAKHLAQSAEETLSGTAVYMPPEKLKQYLRFQPTQTANLTNTLGDIYAFGVTIYSVWAMSPPYIITEDELRDLWTDIVYEDKRPDMRNPELSDMPQALKDLMTRCWARDPSQRPQSFKDVVREMERIIGVPARLTSSFSKPVDAAPAAAAREDSGYTGSGASGISGSTKRKDELQVLQANSGAPSIPATTTPNLDQLTKDAKQGNPAAQRSLGKLFMLGTERVTQDHFEAARWLRPAAIAGDAVAQSLFGDYTFYGYGCTPIDNCKAVELWRQAAENGDPFGQLSLGLVYRYGVGGELQDDSESKQWFDKAIRQGYPQSLVKQAGNPHSEYWLGLCYAEGIGFDKDFAWVDWFRKASEKGFAPAMNKLGECYEDGDGVEKNPSQAVSWYRKAADQGHALAQNNLGQCYLDGFGVEKNLTQAVALFRKAADQGCPAGQFSMGLCYGMGNGVEMDTARAVQWVRKAAEQGFAEAQNQMGICYRDGFGVTIDFSKSVEWFLKAAERGNSDGQNTLGCYYKDGSFLKKDYSKAIEWFRRAAEQGNADAQTSMGAAYENGLGVERDYKEAVSWYRMAAEQGHPIAQSNLGTCLADGKGVEKADNVQAVVWFRKSAEQGYGIAMNNLGFCYHKGLGVAKDPEQAAAWYRKAANQGVELAQTNLKNMTGWRAWVIDKLVDT
ncbi:kinase-like protein [Gonapodya prolifera JEL478]|uniref:Kinase-like protein n=1 Tax=Gonapodya prolifera (strain JEL478) TaxID=1344416 RepID=A0A139AWV5_GONPJ|nr:kinase-like protein [Gonapodya prolifera JEL478]|eukprot:KXS21184.1 kinase-like protein [Gonapodya prolifera JEL478]